MTSISFRLNGADVRVEASKESVVVDWLRHERGLAGTKEGCREGDCGACLVLLGGVSADDAAEAEWLAVPSCLLALDELDGRHIVTIEGLAAAGPTPVMTALHGEGASQCGFCSPGIVVALTAFLLGPGPYDAASAMIAVDGNLCRCTGYAAIRRAAAVLASEFADLPVHFPARLAGLAARGVVPAPLAAAMGERPCPSPNRTEPPRGRDAPVLGGGTDYFVRNPDPDPAEVRVYSGTERSLRRIVRGDGRLEIGAAVTVREFFASPVVRAELPGIEAYARLVASAPIRARATLAGNIANASPVADMTAMLIACAAGVRLRVGSEEREIPMERFFLGYKKIDLKPGERIEAILIPVHGPAAPPRYFSFEKAAKRANLDIASVNSAFACRLENGGGSGRRIMRDARLSAGGVGPIPLFLSAASAYLEGKEIDAETARKAADIAVAACSPQSDVRGTATYRSAMVRRFVYAHFLRLAPDSGLAEELFP